MTIFEIEYLNYIDLADKISLRAELKYEEGDYFGAVKQYYYASNLYEQAKELADMKLDISKRIRAQQKELYCQEKLDELERFKHASKDEVIKE